MSEHNKKDLTVTAGLRNPPQLNDKVLSLAMHVTNTAKDGIYSTMSDGKQVLSEPNVVQPSTEFGIVDDCQTCTMFMNIPSTLKPTMAGAKVKVVLGVYKNKPEIIIS